MKTGDVLRDSWCLILFIGIVGGLLYGLIKENSAVTLTLAFLGLATIGQIAWKTINDWRIDNIDKRSK